MKLNFKRWLKRGQWKIEREKQVERRKQEEAKQQLKDDELNKLMNFFNDADRWKKFMILKEYFDYMKSENLKNLDGFNGLKIIKLV